MKRIIFLALGSISLAMAIIGILLPLLPTTPLVLLSAYFFSKSSPRLYQKMLSSELFGPLIKNWQREGAICLRAKIMATILIVLAFALTFALASMVLVVKIILLLVAFGILLFIWSRPSGSDH